MRVSNEWNNVDKEYLEVILKHQNDLPIKVGGIAKDLGITVKKATLSAGISGEIKEINDEVIIRVNRHDVKQRQRFTIAHEIAHFLIHREKIGDGITDDILYRSSLTDEQEAQANRLAADILMPWRLLEISLNNLKGKKIEEKAEIIANEADVSVTAMKIRLGNI